MTTVASERLHGDACTRTIEGFTVRHATPGDLEGILDVLNASFDHWPPCEIEGSQADYVAWYFEQPLLGDDTPTFDTALHGDRVVAMRSTMRRRFWLRGEPVASRIGTSAAVHPDFRGRHLNSIQIDWDIAHSNHGAALSFSLAPQVHVRERAVIRPGRPFGRYARIDDVWGSARARPGRTALAAPIYALMWLRGRRPRTRPAPAPGLEVRPLSAFSADTDALFDRVRPEFDFIMDRSAAFMNWRYRDPRGGRFEAFRAVEGERAVGYVVVTAADGRGHIADLLAEPGRPDIVHALTLRAIRWARERGLPGTEIILPGGHPYLNALHAEGFVRLSGRSETLQASAKYEGFRLPDAAVAFLGDPEPSHHVTAGDWNEI